MTFSNVFVWNFFGYRHEGWMTFLVKNTVKEKEKGVKCKLKTAHIAYVIFALMYLLLRIGRGVPRGGHGVVYSSLGNRPRALSGWITESAKKESARLIAKYWQTST
jgi:hypothetical protein